MEPSLAQQQALIESLRHTLEQPVEVVETHISWVLLVGGYAYKIKKAISLGFLDFSTLEKRRFYCAEELRLNRRLAPDLYLEAVAISGSAGQPRLNSGEPAIEYAVKMRRFPQSGLLDQALLRGDLTAATIDAIARKIADFHAAIAVAAGDSPFGTSQRVHQPVAENFAQIRAQRGIPPHPELDELERWSEREYRARQAAFAARKAQGCIRECHGDLHLGNIVLLDGEAVPFDGIEFNENLRWIDVVSEAAFLAMDLQDRQQPRLARRFLNAYLEQTGDYAGLAVLRYYLAYRAMVRAKVAAIRAGQSDPAGAEQEGLRNLLNGYIELAQGYTRPARPFLAITHGLSGSGKTTATQALLEAMEVFRIRSDVERKRLYGLKPEARSDGAGIYSPEATRRTYDKLAELARGIIRSGFPAIVDAAFLKPRERAAFRELARELGVPFAILDFTAPASLLRERVEQRRRHGHDASEADVAVLENQLRYGEALDGAERAEVIAVDTGRAIDVGKIIKRLENLLPAALC